MKKLFNKSVSLLLCAAMLITAGCGSTQGTVSTESVNTSEVSTESTVTSEPAVEKDYGMDIHARSKAETDPNNGARPETLEGTTSFRAMSFNVQQELITNEDGTLDEDSQNRVEAVRQEILFYNPDFIGLQEDRKIWIDNINLEGYKVIQDSSITAGAERCAIYYRDGIKLLKAGSLFLSSNGLASGTILTVADLFEEGGKYQMSPEHLEMLGIKEDSDNSIFKEDQFSYVAADGSTQSYAEGYKYLAGRGMTYGVFDVNGQPVIVVNTHFQNRKQNAPYYNDALAMLRNLERVKHFDKMQEVIEDLKTQFEGAVAYITGDYNDLPGTGVYDAAVLDYGYQDAAVAAPESYSIAGGTWNMAFDLSQQGDNYPSKKEGQDGDNLDYMFVDPKITIQKFRVGDGKAEITAVDGSQKTIYTADHRPLVGDFAVKTETTGAMIDLAEPVVYDLDKVSIYSGTPDTSWYVEGQKEFTLTTADQLAGIQTLRDESEGEITFEGVTIKLGKDMILNEGTVEDIVLRDAGNYAWKRLNSAYNFMGTFDGQGHTISGLYMALYNHGKAGMFGAVAGNAVIKNFTLENVVFSGATESKDTMGILASRIAEDGSNVTFSDITINNASMAEAEGSMEYVGGFIGRVDEMLEITLTMKNCNFNGNINFPNGTGIGGLIGLVFNRNAVINLKNCNVAGDLTAEDYCGGLVGSLGDNATLNIDGCTYTGNMVSGGQMSDTIGNPDEQ